MRNASGGVFRNSAELIFCGTRQSEKDFFLCSHLQENSSSLRSLGMTFFKSINNNNYGKDKETERERGNDLSGNDIRCCRRFQNKHSHNKNTAPILAGLGTWALL